jgi:hypothetical protein
MRNGSSDEGTLAGNGDYKASYVHGINSRRKNVSKGGQGRGMAENKVSDRNTYVNS